MKFGKIKALKKIPRIHFIISLILIFFVWLLLALSNKEIPRLGDFIGFSSVLVGFYFLIIVIPWVYIPRPIILKVWLTIASIFLTLKLGRFLYTFAGISTVRPLEIFGLSFGILTLSLITLMPVILTILLIIFDKTNVKSNYIPLFIYPFLIFLTLNHILIASSTPFMQSLLVAVKKEDDLCSDLSNELRRKESTIEGFNYLIKDYQVKMNNIQNWVDDCIVPCASKSSYTKEHYLLIVSDDSWLNISSEKVGIQFDYPFSKNETVSFFFADYPKRDGDPTGIDFRLTSDLQGRIMYGYSWYSAFGRSESFFYKWDEQQGKYFIYHSRGNGRIEVKKLLVKDTSFETQALLYKQPCEYFCGDPGEPAIDPEIRYLMVNLPYNHRPDVESVIFIIPDWFSDQDISRFVESIKLI